MSKNIRQEILNAKFAGNDIRAAIAAGEQPKPDQGVWSM